MAQPAASTQPITQPTITTSGGPGGEASNLRVLRTLVVMPLLSSVLLLVALLAVSCSSNAASDGGERTGATTTDGDANVIQPTSSTTPAGATSTRYVVVGASDAVGYGAANPDADAWPEALKRSALPPGATLVNLGIPGATVAVAVEQELPDALAAKAAVALVWLSVNDLVAQVPADTYERQLGGLVRALRAGGETRVLVGNTPPLNRLPIYLACDADPRCGGALPPASAITGAVDAFNAAIARVVAAEGAELVDLHATTLTARAEGTETALVGVDGFHPSTAGHRAIAAAFASVLGRPR